MSLRTRTMFVVVLAALLPVIGVGLWARANIIDGARTDYERRLSATVTSAKLRIEERFVQDRRAVDRMCDRDLVVDKLMLDLAAERFGPASEDELVALLPPTMRSLGLDTLVLVDARAGDDLGRVFASGHFPGRAGARDPELVQAARSARDRWFLRDERIRAGGDARDARALLAACNAERGSVRVLVVGGRLLDAGFADSLLGDVTPVRLTLVEGGTPPSETRTRKIAWSFLGSDGRPAAHLVASLDEAPLREQLAALDRGFLVAGGVALAFAFAFGLLLAITASRPLATLEAAASRVATGDLDATIAVETGGEVGRALTAFNRMTKELRSTREKLIRAERIAAWRDIARRIAHEIKNPLLPIQMSIETMRKTHSKNHPDFEEIFEESTTTILEEVERLKRIVTEFSNFARLPRPKPRALDVREVLTHVVGLHTGGDVMIRLTEPPELGEVRADREQLTQVFVNLVQNAADASRAEHPSGGGAVDVVVTPRPGGAVEIAVRDNGPGIVPEMRTRIFEPYFTTKAGGTGLGLAIVHRIVTDHGGAIEVGEAPSGGAELRVTLTREGPPLEADVSQSDAGGPTPPPVNY